MKDENVVNEDFRRNGTLPTLERVIEATQGKVVLSFVPGRLPKAHHSKPIQVKLSQAVVDYLFDLTTQHDLELGQLGVYHCCDRCYQPGKDRHSHEEFLRHGTNEREFSAGLEIGQEVIRDAFGRYPKVFTSPQNWMHNSNGNINREALKHISDSFDIIALTHSGRVFGIPFYTETHAGEIIDLKDSGYIDSHLEILPTVDFTRDDQKAMGAHDGFYVHYDDLLGGYGEGHVREIENMRGRVVRPSQVLYNQVIGISELQKDVKRTAFLRRMKELVR